MIDYQLFHYILRKMEGLSKKINNLLYLLLIINSFIFAQISEQSNIKSWKSDLQVLLGFTGEEVDGIMGVETFNALKRFAYHHDLTDVVMRGQFEDIEYWGFEQYLIKYHRYWIREIKNQRIFNDLHDKEYLQQADETLYTFEIAIQNAKLEVERLAEAQKKALRLAQEKQELEKWEMEKREAERLTAELNKSILEAEVEADKWALERLRAQRLAAEKKEIDRLNSRKAEANRLTNELGEIITSAKSEIDRLIDENKKMKQLIENSEKTETMAEELLIKLSDTQNQLDGAKSEIQSLSSRNDTLEIKLEDAKVEIEEMIKNAGIVTKIDSQKQKKWYERFALDINNDNLIAQDIKGDYAVTPTVALDFLYYLPWKPKILKKEINLRFSMGYSPMFKYVFKKNSYDMSYLNLSINGNTPLKWKNVNVDLNVGVSILANKEKVEDGDGSFNNGNYISFRPSIKYQLPLKYKFISTSFFLSPQIMQSITSDAFGGSEQLIYLNTGLRFSIN